MNICKTFVFIALYLLKIICIILDIFLHIYDDRISIFIFTVFTGLVSPVLLVDFALIFFLPFLVDTNFENNIQTVAFIYSSFFFSLKDATVCIIFKIVSTVLFQVPSNQRDIRYYVICRFLKTLCPPAFVFLVNCRR